MSNSKVTYWDQESDRQIDEFSDGWDWNRVFCVWHQRVTDFQVKVFPLFHPIPVHDPNNPQRQESSYSWWPADSLRSKQEEFQRHLYKHPGSPGPVDGSSYPVRKGEQKTLEKLWQYRTDLNTVSAVFIAASLFPRLDSSRRDYAHANWPPKKCVKVLADFARSRWLGEDNAEVWHYWCTDVLPCVRRRDCDCKIRSMEALIRYLAEEHVEILKSWRPVVIEFVPKCDPFLEKTLRDERVVEEAKSREWREKYEKEKDDKEQEHQRLLREHSRYGEWPPSDDEIERLVWTMSSTRLAEQFGISDVSISKRCKKAGIPKPRPGFWARVEAGRIPHPNGIPAKDEE